MIPDREQKGGPDFIIIGAMKCATTSLRYYLGLHPDICMSAIKEPDFFILERNWTQGIDWYRSLFQGEAKRFGEASTGYTFYPVWQGVPERMQHYYPNIKIIYILRDPVERMLAHYRHSFLEGRESRPLKELLSTEAGFEYICRSRYGMQLEQYLQFFSMDHILIVTSEKLLTERRRTLRKIFRFLGVDEEFSTHRFHLTLHTGTTKMIRRIASGFGGRVFQRSILGIQPMTDTEASFLTVWRNRHLLVGPGEGEQDDFREQLSDHVRKDTDRLREITGMRFLEWCV